jgi:2,4-dienoyl-CoA reductase-like NADH-dependent reductase (Old Yellow Enzyme family)
MTQSPLLTPIRIGKLELPARVIKAATIEGRCNDDGSVSDSMIEFHEHIAKGGTPMQVTGPTPGSAIGFGPSQRLRRLIIENPAVSVAAS